MMSQPKHSVIVILTILNRWSMRSVQHHLRMKMLQLQDINGNRREMCILLVEVNALQVQTKHIGRPAHKLYK